MTTKELIEAARNCACSIYDDCKGCPFIESTDCIELLLLAMAEELRRLEKKCQVSQ